MSFRFRLFAPLRLEEIEALPVDRRKDEPTRTVLFKAIIGHAAGERTIHVVEKIFHPGRSSQEHAQNAIQYLVNSIHLRRLGVPAARVRLLPTGKGLRLFVGDPTRGDQRKIFEWADMDGGIEWESKRLPNFQEVNEQIRRHTAKAEEAGLKIRPRAWSIIINKRTGDGTPIIHDYKWTRPIFGKADKIASDWRRLEAQLERKALRK
ncbi:MAG: hypothetical protein AABW54_01580 [Candidatus Micrarchaeota archaeon]